jgi:hypothetical protein
MAWALCRLSPDIITVLPWESVGRKVNLLQIRTNYGDIHDAPFPPLPYSLSFLFSRLQYSLYR